MRKKRSIILFIFILFFNSCGKENVKENLIKEKRLESQVLEVYSEGMKSLNEGDAIFAAKKFNEAETLFPQSEWAPKSSLMAAYSYYTQDYYLETILELERFLRVYPKHNNIDYAYYLLGVSYYEQIVDEKKTYNLLLRAKYYFDYLIKNFPKTEYSIDSEFKIGLIEDILASKELYIGRYYLEKMDTCN